jgi:hypothetical protein
LGEVDADCYSAAGEEDDSDFTGLLVFVFGLEAQGFAGWEAEYVMVRVYS